MPSDLERQDSLRTVLRKQKRRLSTTDRKQSSPDLGERSSPVSLRSTPTRSQGGTPTRSNYTPPRKHTEIAQEAQSNSKSEFYSIEELSPSSTPATSPTTSRSPSPCTPAIHTPCPPSPSASHSPIRPDSPLLCPHTLSPALKRARSFNKNLRRAASFRAARERQSASRNNSPACSRNNSPACSRNNSPACSRNASPERNEKHEVSFHVKKALGVRKGWKIMADDGEEIDNSALKTVVTMIKEMECQGFAVPDRITVKVT